MRKPDWWNNTKTVSQACADELWSSIHEDTKLQRYHGRLLAMFKNMGLRKPLEIIVLSPGTMDGLNIQSGLLWAAQADVLHRCLEQIVLNHPEDFPNREIREAAKFKLGFVTGSVA